MEQKNNGESLTPASVRLLFNNEKLELMKMLCLVNAINSESSKQRKVEELLFYYSLVNFDVLKIFDKKINDNYIFKTTLNRYFRFEIQIEKLLLYMYEMKFIDIIGNEFVKKENLKVKLLPSGKSFFEENKTEYLV